LGSLAGGQVELVPIFNVAAAFDDDVGMRLEQADDLLAGGDGLAVQNLTFGLREQQCVQVLPFRGVLCAEAVIATPLREYSIRPAHPTGR
jgi:hypothetical protein